MARLFERAFVAALFDADFGFDRADLALDRTFVAALFDADFGFDRADLALDRADALPLDREFPEREARAPEPFEPAFAFELLLVPLLLVPFELLFAFELLLVVFVWAIAISPYPDWNSLHGALPAFAEGQTGG